ncbi:MAG: hypothetical protein P4L84_30135 [Isosphaeraceae bacterium]|nr:hypothetical protein [Isosphaeraceae bacterium]
MNVPVLVCRCGQRLRAPGAKPGRVGRCPKCGAPLRVPEASAPASVQPSVENDTPSAGYYLEDTLRSGPSRPEAREPRSPAKERSGGSEAKSPTGPAFPPRGGPAWLYPLRGAESLTVVVVLGVAYWIFMVLVPEYCLSVLSDAESMGAAPMGRLIAIISGLPAAILLLPALFYTLQYLGRVLVSSAQGDDRPPRPPDRNFEGFLTGFSPWLLWLLTGAGVGFLPFLVYWVSHGDGAPVSPLVVLVLGLLGLPYAAMALMMTFLHDDAFAAKPAAVLSAIVRLGVSFLAACLAVAAVIGLVFVAFAGAHSLRSSHFWLYIVVALPCWLLAHWAAIVVMRVLGRYYYCRRKLLRWHRKRPRWGVNWGL